MDAEDILYERTGACALVRFNRPAQHNAMTAQMYGQLSAVCDELEQDPSVRVLVLRGVGGKAFIAGTDIRHFTTFSSPKDGVDYEKRIDAVVGQLERLPCTTIAVLEGVCAGGGVPIALACDFRLADPALKFGVPIAKTLGNCLSMANIARLIDYIGIAQTKEMLMLGRFMDAEHARTQGIVNAIHAQPALEQAVKDLSDEILAMAPLTLQAVKTAMRRTLESRRASPEFGEDLIRLCYTSTDFREAVAAFLEKRRYTWQGV